MKTIKKIIAVLVCVSIVINMSISIFAANETNTLGVTFDVTLDTPEITSSSQEQTVTMTLTASKAVTVDGIGFTVVWDPALTLTSITGDSIIGAYNAAATNLANGIAGWSSPDAENKTVTTLAIITFTVPANTPASTYNVGVENLELTSDYGGTIWEKSASASTTLTVIGASPEPDPTEGYSAAINSLDSTVSVDDTVTVNVGVSHSSDTSFAAGEVIVTYDNTLLEFDETASILGNATAKVANGTITLEDYGTDKSFGTDIYVLKFKAIADGTANVVLTSAAFIDSEEAVSSDLIEATITDGTVSVVIEKKEYSVTLPEIFEGPAAVTDGENYTFSVADGQNYNYDSVNATVNGETVPVIDNGDGTYTIENVTGNIVITGSRVEKNYNVTLSGNAANDMSVITYIATYNTDYEFTLPNIYGWAFSVDSITIGGTTYTGYSVSGSDYTIPGSAINGDIEIVVNKISTEVSVSVEGSGAGAAAGYNPTAIKNESYTLSITTEAGYNYSVTATMGGVATTVTNNGDNTYTIASVTGDIVFTVERTVVVDGVSVQQYLTLNGTNMWLVLNNATLASGKVATYDGNNMYWSETYGAYCYLIIADTADSNTVKNLIGITDGTAAAVDYGMDVNKTGKVDASDAQLTYNMYNAVYSAFDTDATVEKFLRADVNGDKTVNVEDATAIIASLLQ